MKLLFLVKYCIAIVSFPNLVQFLKLEETKSSTTIYILFEPLPGYILNTQCQCFHQIIIHFACMFWQLLRMVVRCQIQEIFMQIFCVCSLDFLPIFFDKRLSILGLLALLAHKGTYLGANKWVDAEIIDVTILDFLIWIILIIRFLVITIHFGVGNYGITFVKLYV